MSLFERPRTRLVWKIGSQNERLILTSNFTLIFEIGGSNFFLTSWKKIFLPVRSGWVWFTKNKIDPWEISFLVVREIDCGNWLARGYMPAHQHCDLFYPLGWGSDWVHHKLGNAPVLRSGTGSGVLSGWSGVRHPLSPVIRLGLRTLRKKRKSSSHKCVTLISLGRVSFLLIFFFFRGR